MSMPGALAEQSSGLIIIWSLALICLLVVAFAAVLWVRRRMTAVQQSRGATFTLSDLRRMHEAGQIDDQQFHKLREAIIGAARK